MSVNNSINNGKKVLAQGFSISTPREVAGIYATKIGLFFSKRSDSSHIRLSVVEINNDVPDIKLVVPGTTVILQSSAVLTSNTAESETIFEFDYPVFLDQKKKYAFTLSSSSPDFEVWAGTQGETDVTTGRAIASNPLTDKAYFSENSLGWSEVLNQDIKFKLYRAKYTAGATATIDLKTKANLDYLLLEDVKGLHSEFSTIDEVYVYNTTTNALVTTKRADFVSFDRQRLVLTVDVKEGTFAAGDVIRIVRTNKRGVEGVSGTQPVGVLLEATIDQVMNYKYNSILPRLLIDKKTTSSIGIALRGTTQSSNVYSIDANRIALSETEAKPFPDASRYLMSYSNEVANISANSSILLRATLSATNEFIAPVISLNNSTVMLITNAINDSTEGEETRYGESLAKYVSRIVTLAEGMDAEDLKVYLKAYKPVNTDIKVYVKLQNAADSSSFDDLPWIEMVQSTATGKYSDPKNPEDYREYSYDISPDDKNGEGIVQYSTDSGTFTGYKSYSVKIVLLANAGYEHNPPTIDDLRAIALQV